ncbi:MAG: response regulator [Deltaproteobacteria bacterium]|jgi:CheY-like chemotaxis protein|nr:response regulator [Deltaproteobacteria bacterium]
MVNGTETVLLVDDEEIVLGVGKQMLQRLGYSVKTAGSGLEAVDVYKNSPDDVDLVLLDMIMPGMEAGDIYDKLKAINPAIKVLLSSGYSLDQKASAIIDRGCNGFIQKPFNMKSLEEKIEEILK